MLPDKYNLTEKEARHLLEHSMVDMIHQLSRIELVTTTYAQTKAIVEGISVNDVTEDEILVIVNLRNAYMYLLEETSEFTLEVAERINGFVAFNEALEWGVIRNGEVSIGGVSYKPTIPVRADVIAKIDRIMHRAESNTYRAIKYMYFAMRNQLFWDGNKRTAILSANYLLLQKRNGILVIREEDLEHWHELLTSFYETDDDKAIIEWTYKNCIINTVKEIT